MLWLVKRDGGTRCGDIWEKQKSWNRQVVAFVCVESKVEEREPAVGIQDARCDRRWAQPHGRRD